MDISNKSLAFILVVAIVISLGGTIVSLNRLNQLGFTGFATSGNDTGTANLSINNSVIITFTTSNVDFGSGYTNDSGVGIENCTIDTNGTNPNGTGGTVDSWTEQRCIGFNSGISPFLIENDGNLNVNLSLQSDSNASDFIGGTFPAFQWFVSNNEPSSCTGTLQPTTFTTVNKTAARTVCTSFSYTDSSDLLNLHIRVNIPQDATPGDHTATITAVGTAS